MGINLTIIDHHILPNASFIHNPKVKMVFGYDQENYFKNIKEHIDRDFDYVFFDENPDAFISASLYLKSREKRPMFKCLPRALNKKDFGKLESAGLKDVVSFNCLWIYESDIDYVDSVTLVNPHESGLENISASHMMYKTLSATTDFMRDLAGIAVVMDYTLDAAFDLIFSIVKAYPELFKDVAERIENITLNKYNLQDTKFGDITAMMRAPSILYGVKGVDNLVEFLVQGKPFTMNDLMDNDPETGTGYLRDTHEKYVSIFEEEMELFEKEKTVQDVVVSYAPHFHSQNFVREFANRIKDRNIDSIIVIKTPTADKRTKFSIRRGELNIDLGKTLEEMGVGGGNPFAAGCTVDDAAEFEKAFMRKVEAAGLQ